MRSHLTSISCARIIFIIIYFFSLLLLYFLACYLWPANETFSLHACLQDTVILHSELPLLTCIYGGLWTPFLLFDTVAKAEAFDIGLVRHSPCQNMQSFSAEQDALDAVALCSIKKAHHHG